MVTIRSEFFSRAINFTTYINITRIILILILSVLTLSALSCDSTGSSNDEMEVTNPDEDGGGSPGTISFIPGGIISNQPEPFSYVEGGSERQTLDLYRISNLPSTANTGAVTNQNELLRPAYIFIHGGGWVSGSKDDVVQELFDLSELSGFHLVSIGYRLATDTSAPWPAIIEDVNAAIRWIKLNSELLGIDPDALILIGASAGAHLAALAATAGDVTELQGLDNPGANTDVRAAILLFGIYNLNSVFSIEAINLFFDLGCNIEAPVIATSTIFSLIDDCSVSFNPFNPLENCNQSRLDVTSPINHIDSGDPPMYIAHGTNDCTVLWIQSQEFVDTLNILGVPNQFNITEGGGHDISTLVFTLDEIVNFLKLNL